ncbi:MULTISPECIES: SIS domain-containing protein [unclassified Schlesneria]|uniref:SIS domain-containing protein n=1 Tax=Schlesneria TaxID=656899 RepID=UPI002EEB598A
MIADRSPYSKFNLITDMIAAAEVIRTFDPSEVKATAEEIGKVGKLLISGEGSSRMFPAKSAIAHARRKGWPFTIATEAGRQSQEYALSDWAVLGISNSGRTAEVIRLFNAFNAAGHTHRYSLAAFAESPLEALAARGHVLKCGKEGAVAATKSVVEQALFCRALVEALGGDTSLKGRLPKLADQFLETLALPIDAEISQKIAQANSIYFSGRNDGVAEELTLKTNEITRKRGDYLEGTYAVHGIEEAMQADDVVIWIDPYEESEQKFHDVLVKGVGLTVIAISSRPTLFPTIQIPDAGDLNVFLQLAAGWNLLVEAGLRLDINIDKPVRARKVGNEFV